MNGEANSKTDPEFGVLLVADDDDSIGLIRRGLAEQGLRKNSLRVARNRRSALQALSESAAGAKILLVDLDVAGHEFFAGLSKLPHHADWKLFIFASPDHDYDPSIPSEDSIAGFLDPAKRANDYSNLTQMLRYHSETYQPTPLFDRRSRPENAIASRGPAGLQP